MSGPVLARGFPKDSLDKNPLLRQWISLAVPGVVTLRVGKVEFGQGIGTALAQIAAEELGVDPARVAFAPISTATSPDEGVTSGSVSVQHSGSALRRVCATVRGLGLAAFCERHGMAAALVQVADGTFSAPDGGASASYWTLGLEERLDQPVSDAAVLQPAAGYITVGRAEPRRDLPRKVSGQPAFIQDLVLPGLLHGRVVRVPNRFATLAEVDEASFKARFPAVTLVRDGSFLGVLAAGEEEAIVAAADLAQRCRWQMPALLPDSGTLMDFLRGTPAQADVVSERASPSPQAAPALQRLAASYSRPFIAHASISPSCALAQWQPGRLEVWSHSQGIYNLKADLKVFLQRDHPEVPAEAVVVNHVEGAGCYGHNPADDVAFDAVLLARAAGGRPVRVLWSRADELSCGPFGPAHAVALEAGLDADGRVVDWQHTIWANGYTARPGRAEPGSLSFLAASQLAEPFEAPVSLDPPMSAGGGSHRNAVPLYDFPRHRVVTNRLLEMPVRTSAIRALGGYGNVWAIESFMDELALAAGQDPVAFRLAHLVDPRGRAVIERVVEAASWWRPVAGEPEGTGRGLAFARYKNTGAWCAVAVRVHAERAVRLLDINIAADVGLVINPDGVANQLEGGAVQSCSWTLKEQVAFSRTEMTTRSWADYPILTFSETPRVQVVLIDRPDEPALGAGEAAQGPTAAAIGNAVFNALGVRVRDLPLTPERILATVSL